MIRYNDLSDVLSAMDAWWGKLPVIIDADVENMPKEMLKMEIRPDTKRIAELLQDEEKSRYYSKFAHFGERGESLRIR